MKKKAFKNNMNYVEALKLGLADYKDIDQYLHEWHNSDSNLEAYEYLGMTKEQYFKFAIEHEKALKEMFPKK
ncbi:MAG: hypothetical protein IKP65_00180 [Alphaproteobacteria bacterium]|nr:hypothetical protein [Alphaproteobacteria bacterium]